MIYIQDICRIFQCRRYWLANISIYSRYSNLYYPFFTFSTAKVSKVFYDWRQCKEIICIGTFTNDVTHILRYFATPFSSIKHVYFYIGINYCHVKKTPSPRPVHDVMCECSQCTFSLDTAVFQLERNVYRYSHFEHKIIHRGKWYYCFAHVLRRFTSVKKFKNNSLRYLSKF